MILVNKIKKLRKQIFYRPNKFRVATALAATVLIVAALLGLIFKTSLKGLVLAAQKTTLPNAISKTEFLKSKVASKFNSLPQSNSKNLPKEKNIFVPFVLQAPLAVWDALHEDACEEASAIMAEGFIKGISSYSPKQMEERIQQIVAFEEKRLGYSKDTTAAETTLILNEFLKVKAWVKPITSAADIKKEITNENIVIIPAWGKALQNPYFKNGGPVYHMLVIKGYTPTGFITNDPGTKRGENYFYKTETIFNAVHDWNNGDVPNGQKVMIVIGE